MKSYKLWTKRTAFLLQSESPKLPSVREKASPADYTICLSHPIKEPLFIGVETPADKEVWNLILGDFIRRTSELRAVDSVAKHALGAAVERTRKNHQWRDPDLRLKKNKIHYFIKQSSGFETFEKFSMSCFVFISTFLSKKTDTGIL